MYTLSINLTPMGATPPTTPPSPDRTYDNLHLGKKDGQFVTYKNSVKIYLEIGRTKRRLREETFSPLARRRKHHG